MVTKISINNTCENCLSCTLVCEENAILEIAQKSFIDESQCTLCELCVYACPAKAIELEKVNNTQPDHP